jgi:septal ring factor EnvC (AmiA/AmiB activator)
MTIIEMVARRKEIEKKMEKLNEIIYYLAEQHDDLLEELKDLDSELSYISTITIQEAEKNNG